MKKKYAKEGIIASREVKKKETKKILSKIDRALDPKMNPDGASTDETGEWAELRKYIRLHFPEATEHDGLSANQIMIGVAHCLGWSKKRIIDESGLNRRTVDKWLRRPEIEHLMNEFRVKMGEQDPNSLVTANGFNGLKMIQHILSLAPSVDNMDLLKVQIDVAKFATKQSLGEAQQNINLKGATSFKDIAEAIHKKKEDGTLELSEEEEEDLFLN